MKVNSTRHPACGRVLPRWRTAVLGLGLLVGLGAQSFAAEPVDLANTLQGRWAMASDGSSFREAVTGPAPDAAQLVVTRDDAEHFAYQLVETRGGREVGRAAYDVSFSGSPSTSQVDGQDLAISAARDDRGGVVLRAPPVGGTQAFIRVYRTGPDTAVLEHDVTTDGAVLHLETIALTRTDNGALK